MKRILMVTLSRHTCFQDGVFSMYRELQGKPEYTILTLTKKDSDYPVIRTENNYFVDAPENPGLSKEFFNIKNIMQMIKILRNSKFDAVYFESFHTWNYLIILYCKAMSIPISHSLHDVILHQGDNGIKIKSIINYSIVRLSDRVIVRSNNGYENAIQKYPKYKSKIFCADLWYTFPEFCPPKGRSVLFFGRMNWYKGIDYLYEIIKATPTIEYIVAGKAESINQPIVKSLAQLPNVKLENRVIPYDEMHEYFYASRCVVLPYRSATQSGVIVDAYKHSRPVIAFRVGALGEQIIERKTGYVIEPDDINAFVSAVKEIINMPDEKYEQMCRKAYEYGVSKYSPVGQEQNFLNAIGAR